MRALFAVGLVVAVAAAVGAQDKAEKLDGSWLIVGMEKAGQKLPDDFFKNAPEKERTVKIAGDKLTAMKKDGKEDSLTVKFDPSKTPKQVTTTEAKPGGKAETSVGIYKLDGDTLTICAVESEKEADRPKEFKTAKDSNAMILVLKRLKDK